MSIVVKLLANMQMTEMSEVAEGFVKGSVGSSTMPHKRNPNTLESLQMLARLIKGSTEAAIESMFCAHERDGALWKIEWKAANEAVILAGSSAMRAKKVFANLTVNGAGDLDIRGLVATEVHSQSNGAGNIAKNK